MLSDKGRLKKNNERRAARRSSAPCARQRRRPRGAVGKGERDRERAREKNRRCHVTTGRKKTEPGSFTREEEESNGKYERGEETARKSGALEQRAGEGRVCLAGSAQRGRVSRGKREK